MKKTVKPAAKTTKKSTKKNAVVETPVIKINMADILTFDDMLVALVEEKANANQDISAAEYKAVLKIMIDTAILAGADALTNSVCTIARLTNDLAWERRPWYKKLMFWKKKPACAFKCA